MKVTKKVIGFAHDIAQDQRRETQKRVFEIIGRCLEHFPDFILLSWVHSKTCFYTFNQILSSIGMLWCHRWNSTLTNDQEGLREGLWLFPAPEVMTKKSKETILLLMFLYILLPHFSHKWWYTIHVVLSCPFLLNVYQNCFMSVFKKALSSFFMPTSHSVVGLYWNLLNE